MNVAYGTLPEWFAAIGTVGALALTYRLLKKELRELVANERERLERQARSVALWYGDESDTKRTVYVYNGSDAPVYNVLICFVANDDPATTAPHRQMCFPVLQPRETKDWHRTRLDALTVDQGRRLIIEFRDSYGRFWRSHPDTGELSQITPLTGRPAPHDLR